MNVDTTGQCRVRGDFLNGNREEGWESSWAGQPGTMRDVSFNLEGNGNPFLLKYI